MKAIYNSAKKDEQSYKNYRGSKNCRGIRYDKLNVPSRDLIRMGIYESSSRDGVIIIREFGIIP